MAMRGELILDYDGVIVEENKALDEKKQKLIDLEEFAKVLTEADARRVNVRVLTGRGLGARNLIQKVMNRVQQAAKLSGDFPLENIHCVDHTASKHDTAARKVKFVTELLRNGTHPESCMFIDDTKLNTDAMKVTGVHVHHVEQPKLPDMANILKLPTEEQEKVQQGLERKAKAHFTTALNFVRTFPTVKESVNSELCRILMQTKYWSEKTHYQFFRGGVRVDNYRVPTNIAKMMETNNSIEKLAEVADKAITPDGRKPFSRNDATHAFYKMLSKINTLFKNEENVDQEKEIRKEIQDWKMQYSFK